MRPADTSPEAWKVFLDRTWAARLGVRELLDKAVAESKRD